MEQWSSEAATQISDSAALLLYSSSPILHYRKAPRIGNAPISTG
jgi:hypothetical protein